MRYGFILPGGDVQTIPEMAGEAEAAGWDGVFIADCISIDTSDNPPGPWYDPWILLALMATRTSRITLGPMVAAISRRRPWKLARETMTLDHLSQGRIVLPVGLGAARDDAGFYKVGEEMSLRGRASIMDECLDILNAAWSGEPFSYEGNHYHVQRMQLLPPSFQQPRIPVWPIGVWPHEKSMQRVLRWDGIVPQKKDGSDTPLTPDDIRAIKVYVETNRKLTTPFDIIWEGETPANDPEQAATLVRPWIEAGITWWMESRWNNATPQEIRERIRQGPPRII
ncbi:LLM class flavin-dependent oxidoreductase [Dictyobacter arantiisoli]|uniref:Luciferase-like protein n=1 Tax=Dictyobacter arantiisoli TaxID=2014874 RepID=A0A5A5T6K7_9CHLR|nr:LLM class flavin-dependent oxidoreductase [Dictyobacter arantiisoli]GCF07022.1 luciferase-like protein [Dictyobacter arantiisoli]